MTIVDATGSIHDTSGRFNGHVRAEVDDLDLGVVHSAAVDHFAERLAVESMAFCRRC